MREELKLTGSLSTEAIVGAAKVGAIFGTFLGAAFMLRYGRRSAIAVNGLAFTMGPLIMALSSNVWCVVLTVFCSNNLFLLSCVEDQGRKIRMFGSSPTSLMAVTAHGSLQHAFLDTSPILRTAELHKTVNHSTLRNPLFSSPTEYFGIFVLCDS